MGTLTGFKYRSSSPDRPQAAPVWHLAGANLMQQGAQAEYWSA